MIQRYDLNEIGSNCPEVVVKLRKLLDDPENLYDRIARRQGELLQLHHEQQLKRKGPIEFTNPSQYGGYTAQTTYYHSAEEPREEGRE